MENNELFDGTGIINSASCHDTNRKKVPTKLSLLENDMGFIRDEHYHHTDNNFSDEYIDKVEENLEELDDKIEEGFEEIKDRDVVSSESVSCGPEDIELIADRAYKDHEGNVITDTYVTREGLTNSIIDITNKHRTDLLPGSVLPEDLSEATKELLGNKTITNLPDEEDITTYDNTLKFKDKEYSPKDYSGMGRVYLRKHYINGINTLVQHMIDKPNTIYIILYDYCLQELTIEIPENCVLKFEGGSLRNGTIVYNNTLILGKELKFNLNTQGSFKYFSENNGHIILGNNIVDGKNILTLDMFNKPNMVYEIAFNYIILDKIEIPENCTLLFNGGSIKGNYIISNDTILVNPNLDLDIRGRIFNSNKEEINNNKFTTRKETVIHNSFSMFGDGMDEYNLNDKLNMYRDSGMNSVWICILLEFTLGVVKVPDWYEKYHKLGGIKNTVKFIQEHLGTKVDCIKLHKNYNFVDSGKNEFPDAPQAYTKFCKNMIDDLSEIGIHKIFISNEENWRTKEGSIWIKSFNDIIDYAHCKNMKVGFSMNAYTASIKTMDKTLLENVDFLYENFYPELSWKDMETNYQDLPKMIESCKVKLYKSINFLEKYNVASKYGISECGIPDRINALRYPWKWNNPAPFDGTGKIIDLYWRTVIPAIKEVGVKELANWYLDDYKRDKLKESMIKYIYNLLWY